MAQQVLPLIINDLLGPRSTDGSGKAGAADMYSEWVDLLYYHTSSWNIAWTAVAATAGTISFEGTNDPTYAATSIVTCVPTTIRGNGGSLTVPVTAACIECAFDVKDMPRFMRYKNHQTAGGAVGQFSGWLIARGQ